MKTLENISLGLLFSVLFILFILVTTIYFQLLNSTFLFYTLDSAQVYQKVPQLLIQSLPNDPNLSKEEQQEYAKIAKQISPTLIKTAAESNVLQFLDFLHGKSQTITVLIPPIEPKGTEIKWSLSDNPQLAEQLKPVNGAANKVLLVWFVILAGLIGLFYFNNKPGVLVSSGGVVVLLSSVLLFCCWLFGRELSKGLEPSQQLLGLLATSVFPFIVTTWLIMGAIVLVLGLVLKKRKS